jgi:Ca-activated chloride channel family protein
VNRLEGERVGLIAFAGQAVVKCPLTVDYDSFRRALNELDTDSAPRGGTAIGIKVDRDGQRALVAALRIAG